MEAEGSPCGLGYKGQRRKCDRSLGGKYCQAKGKEAKGKAKKAGKGQAKKAGAKPVQPSIDDEELERVAKEKNIDVGDPIYKYLYREHRDECAFFSKLFGNNYKIDYNF